jgi:hypothetical protein
MTVTDGLLQRTGDVVHRAQTVDQLAHRRGQRLVRGVHAREARVTAELGQLHGAQDRPHRRIGEERVVAVPLVGALAHRMDLIQHHDLRRVLVHGLEGRHVHGAEAQRELELLLVVDVLVAEEEHEVVEQRLAQTSDVVVGERQPQVDAADLGADRQRQRPDLDARALRAHGRGLPSRDIVSRLRILGKGRSMVDWLEDTRR